MTRLYDLNLIRFLDFYLALAFVVSTLLRVRQYEAVIRLVRAVPERWPRLFQLVRQHHNLFLTWATVGPALLALLSLLLQMLVSRALFPEAGDPPDGLTVGRLVQMPWALPFVVLLGLAMVAFDGYGTLWVGEVDRTLLEKYFDQAEFWLRSWVAPVVRVFTLGRVNPRGMVAVEVRKALLDASKMLNDTLWWVAAQAGLRCAFGLAVWLTWAFQG